MFLSLFNNILLNDGAEHNNDFRSMELVPTAHLISIVSNPSLSFLLLSGSGIDGGHGKGNRFARVPAVRLRAPRWWLVVPSPVNVARRRDTESHVGGQDARGRAAS